MSKEKEILDEVAESFQEFNIRRNVAEGYNDRSEVMIAVEIDTPEGTDASLFNGFATDVDVFKNFKSDKKAKGRVSKPRLMFNYPDNSLYAASAFQFKSPLSEEELYELAKVVKEEYSKIVFETKIPVEGSEACHVFKGPVLEKESEWFIHQAELAAPQGYKYLEELFIVHKDSDWYEEFLSDKLSIERLVKLCKHKLHLSVPEEVTNAMELPIHTKDELTGAVLVHNSVVEYFDMFRLAQNYVKGFKKDTLEGQLGELMMMDIPFNSYMLTVARRAADGIDPNEDNYKKQLEAALKRHSS